MRLRGRRKRRWLDRRQALSRCSITTIITIIGRGTITIIMFGHRIIITMCGRGTITTITSDRPTIIITVDTGTKPFARERCTALSCDSRSLHDRY